MDGELKVEERVSLSVDRVVRFPPRHISLWMSGEAGGSYGDVSAIHLLRVAQLIIISCHTSYFGKSVFVRTGAPVQTEASIQAEVPGQCHIR